MIVGPWQVGKTTLARQLAAAQSEMPVLWLTGDDSETQQLLAHAPLGRLRTLIHQHRMVVVDEVQRIPGIGLTLKLIHDHFPSVQLLVTGSSALDIAEQTAEPLTGRK
ncbi:MAG: AAA family ATPase [Saprospiraceae bacterium]|nr:AAA family ATPase [Saprospiraceae bacterium]MDW8229547.1 AAA family ATPase [Saprospiraceae bacterium]